MITLNLIESMNFETVFFANGAETSDGVIKVAKPNDHMSHVGKDL